MSFYDSFKNSRDFISLDVCKQHKYITEAIIKIYMTNLFCGPVFRSITLTVMVMEVTIIYYH